MTTPPSQTPLTPDAWTLIVRTVALLVGLAILAMLVMLVWEVLVLILVAGTLAAGMRPAVHRIHAIPLPLAGWHLPRALIVLLLYLVVALAFGVLGRLLLPPLVAEVRQFAAQVPGYVTQAQRAFAELPAEHPWLPSLDLDLPTVLGQLAVPLQTGLPGLFRFAVGVVDALFSLILVLTMALYIVLEGATIRRFALSLVPTPQRERVSAVADEILTKTGQWLLGQIALGIAVFLATALGLLILGAPYALLLAVIAGVLELVPLFGPIMAGTIAVTVTLFTSPLLAAKVLLLAILVQQLENTILVPRIMHRAVGISPLAVLLALATGGKLLGLLGAILAVPIAAALQVLVLALVRQNAQRRLDADADAEAARQDRQPDPG